MEDILQWKIILNGRQEVGVLQNAPKYTLDVKFVDEVLFTIAEGHRKKHCQNDAVKKRMLC